MSKNENEIDVKGMTIAEMALYDACVAHIVGRGEYLSKEVGNMAIAHVIERRRRFGIR